MTALVGVVAGSPDVDDTTCRDIVRLLSYGANPQRDFGPSGTSGKAPAAAHRALLRDVRLCGGWKGHVRGAAVRLWCCGSWPQGRAAPPPRTGPRPAPRSRAPLRGGAGPRGRRRTRMDAAGAGVAGDDAVSAPRHVLLQNCDDDEEHRSTQKRKRPGGLSAAPPTKRERPVARKATTEDRHVGSRARVLASHEPGG